MAKTVKLPVKCSDEIAEFLSTLGYGFNPAERQEDGRRQWLELRKLLSKQMTDCAHA